MNWNWLPFPWRRQRIKNGHEARAAKASAEHKLGEAQALFGRVDQAAEKLRQVNAENHIRTKMEQAFRGQ